MNSEYCTNTLQITPHVKVKLLDPKAKTPVRAKMNDAGLDLCSIENVAIISHTRKIIRTGIILEIPEGYYGRIAPRSGLAAKNGIDVFAGVVDSSYRGEICVILYNSDKSQPLLVHEGDRIAQIIIEKYYNFPFHAVSELSESDRGSDGFGSTGVS